ncbi:MAG TPA: NAD(+) diphosphatase [Thermoanaerobaculia bacterium]|nr:NAD(+) diphosphatase [Thermoanaerobaculia bacterium]
MRPANFFSGSPLDRAAHLRRDSEGLAQALTDPQSLLVPVFQGRSLVRFEGDLARAVVLPVAAAAVMPWDSNDLRQVPFLGLRAGVAHFALDLSAHEEETVRRQLAELGDLTELRTVGAALDREDAGLLAYARGLLHWHARHGYCGACGGETESRAGGHVRQCLRCGTEHFPRTDPAVIMLVTHGNSCLLGHQNAWPEGVYSTLAGFVEPGESLEEAVAREVREEAGVEVGTVEYHSSQPWPFPASIMLGFTARATTTEIRLHDEELADARWFERSELADPAARPIRFPSPASIARRLIEDWLAG